MCLVSRWQLLGMNADTSDSLLMAKKKLGVELSNFFLSCSRTCTSLCRTLACRGSTFPFLDLLCFLDFVLLGVLLLKFVHESLLNVAEMGVLQASQLLKLRRPSWVYVALSPGSADDGTGNQILIRVG